MPSAPRQLPKVTFESLQRAHETAVTPYAHLMRWEKLSEAKLFFDANSDEALKAEWEEHASGVRPIIPHTLPSLLSDFISIKRQHGSAVERALYADMTPLNLVTRLMHRRPLAFLCARDSWLTRHGLSGDGGWETVGTDREQPPLLLEKFLSYDEIALSALVSVAVPTHFVNKGDRMNRGKPGEEGSFERKGVYAGCVGARFERDDGLMEWAHLVVTPEQNTIAKGYGAGTAPPPPPIPAGDAPAEEDVEMPQADAVITASKEERRLLLKAWARFYGKEYLPTHEEAVAAEAASPGTYMKLRKRPNCYLDIALYKQRIRSVAMPYLLDAQYRAQESGATAYVHVVGLGLGVWMVDTRQGPLIVDVYAELLKELSLPNIGVLDFSWFPKECIRCGGARSGDVFKLAAGTAGGANNNGDAAVVAPASTPKIIFSKRNPADPLPQRSPEEPPWLLVAMYAWDGNS